ncbi:MAG: hypothetical protein IJ571_09010 [Ruminococcus sp.]|nr:hypothetical protein [Ruminococcus sp.]
MQQLFNMAGIDCAKIDANSLDGDSGHVWNVAEIDGEVWDFDATWDIRRYYENDADDITELEDIGYYEWFGAARLEKSSYYTLTENSFRLAPATTAAYTEKSAVKLGYEHSHNNISLKHFMQRGSAFGRASFSCFC